MKLKLALIGKAASEKMSEDNGHIYVLASGKTTPWCHFLLF